MVTVTGIPGAGGTDVAITSVGILIVGMNSQITSNGGVVNVIGGAAAAGPGGTIGVEVNGGSVVSAGGNGPVNVTGNGGASILPNNHGIVVTESGFAHHFQRRPGHAPGHRRRYWRQRLRRPISEFSLPMAVPSPRPATAPSWSLATAAPALAADIMGLMYRGPARRSPRSGAM